MRAWSTVVAVVRLIAQGDRTYAWQPDGISRYTTLSVNNVIMSSTHRRARYYADLDKCAKSPCDKFGGKGYLDLVNANNAAACFSMICDGPVKRQIESLQAVSDALEAVGASYKRQYYASKASIDYLDKTCGANLNCCRVGAGKDADMAQRCLTCPPGTVAPMGAVHKRQCTQIPTNVPTKHPTERSPTAAPTPFPT